VKRSLKHWDEAQTAFSEWEAVVLARQEKHKAHRAKLKKHGKDAAGGNRAPDVAHTVVFNKTPGEVFRAMTNEEAFKEASGSACSILPKPGGSFSLYDATYARPRRLEHHESLTHSLTHTLTHSLTASRASSCTLRPTSA